MALKENVSYVRRRSASFLAESAFTITITRRPARPGRHDASGRKKRDSAESESGHPGPGYTLRGLIFGLPVAGTVTPVRRGGALARRPATAGQPPSATPAKAT